ncbi:unnamed protein product, partial [Didymodactylos carnosus]
QCYYLQENITTKCMENNEINRYNYQYNFILSGKISYNDNDLISKIKNCCCHYRPSDCTVKYDEPIRNNFEIRVTITCVSDDNCKQFFQPTISEGCQTTCAVSTLSIDHDNSFKINSIIDVLKSNSPDEVLIRDSRDVSSSSEEEDTFNHTITNTHCFGDDCSNFSLSLNYSLSGLDNETMNDNSSFPDYIFFVHDNNTENFFTEGNATESSFYNQTDGYVTYTFNDVYQVNPNVEQTEAVLEKNDLTTAKNEKDGIQWDTRDGYDDDVV